MKKLVALLIFLIIFALTITSCANKSQEPQLALKNNGELMENVELSTMYFPFETAIAASSHFLKANFLSMVKVGENIVYYFAVQENYFGSETPATISVRKYIGEEISYEQGHAYYLLLQLRGDPYDGEFYCVPGGDVCLPVDTVSNATMHGESLMKHTKMERLKTESDLLTYVLEYFKDHNIPEGRYFGMPFVKSDKIEDIVSGSELVLRVRIDEDVSYQGMVDRTRNLCTVTEVLTGDAKVGQEIVIIFPKGSVMTGEEYIVALNLVSDSDTTYCIYILSSRLGIYDVSRQEEILQYLTTENAG